MCIYKIQYFVHIVNILVALFGWYWLDSELKNPETRAIGINLSKLISCSRDNVLSTPKPWIKQRLMDIHTCEAETRMLLFIETKRTYTCSLLIMDFFLTQLLFDIFGPGGLVWTTVSVESNYQNQIPDLFSPNICISLALFGDFLVFVRFK